MGKEKLFKLIAVMNADVKAQNPHLSLFKQHDILEFENKIKDIEKNEKMLLSGNK